MDIGKELRVIEVEEEILEREPIEVVAIESETQAADAN